MSGLLIATLVLSGIWLGVLTLAVVLVIRQLALLTARFEQTGVSYDFLNDGPEIGGRIPEAVSRALPELGAGSAYLILLSATCNPCREMAVEMQQHPIPMHDEIVVLVPGREELARDVAAMLPRDLQIVRDPEATDIAKRLRMQRVPSALAVREGAVVAKAPPLNSVADLVRFMNKSKTRSEKLVAVSVEGASHVSR